MKRWIMATMIVIALAGLSGCQGSSEVAEPRYSLDVQVGATADGSNEVLCTVTLADAATGAIVLQPTILTQWGEEATISQATDAESFSITVMADNDTQRVEYSAQYLIDGQVMFESRARVSLMMEDDV